MDKYTIEYNGQSLITKNWGPVTEDELAQYREEYYKTPDLDVVKKQMKKITSDGVMIDKITRYYFRDLMAKVKLSTAKWSVEDVLNNTDLCGVFKAKVLNSPKVFKPEVSMGYNIERAIALGGKGYAKVPTQFPFKVSNYIYSKYNINDNVYDFSCGWGSRLLGALKYNLNYYGTDPNNLLCNRLNVLIYDYKTTIKRTNVVDIRCQCSEIFIPEWENTIGLAFSSPPYFSLEDYKIGNQSWKEGVTYGEWLENYMYPTLNNCIRYLVDGGLLAINIKDTTVPIATDVNKYLEDKLEFVESIPLENIKRLKSTGGLTDSTDELIYIYKKINTS